MSKSLPATLNTLLPRLTASGQEVDVDHALAALDNQTWCLAYRGRRVHLSKRWAAAAVQETGAALVVHLRIEVITGPSLGRLHVMARADSDAGSNTVRISDGATNLDLTFGAGTTIQTGTLAGLTPLTATDVTVSMARGGSATYLDLLALTIQDDELALGDLP